jgi:Tfp pilus assembly protein PilF
MERIEQLKSFLTSTPDDSFLQHALALEYIKKGDDNDARLLFENILKQEPGYVGSYYHLGKLLERAMDYEGAIKTYNKGMEAAQKAGDNHSLNELRGALEEITD